MKCAFMKFVAVAVTGIFLLQGCATTGSAGTGGQTFNDSQSAESVTALMACLITGGNCAKEIKDTTKKLVDDFLKNVIIENKKIADAAKVNQEAQKAGLEIPKNEVKPLSFDVALQPSTAVKAGDKVVLVSTAKLYGKGNAKIEQKIQLYDDLDNRPIGQPRTEIFNSVGGAAGAYTSKATYTIPSGWSGRKYSFQTTLLVDGKEVAKNNGAKMTVMAEAPANHRLLASLQ